MPDGKTIRQIADEIGVTRQAVYQKIKSNKHTVNSLQLYTFTVDSTKYYTPEGEKLVKSLFSDKQAVNLPTHSVYTTVNNFTPCKHEEKPLKSTLSSDKAVNEFTVNLTDLFTVQLTEKDHQIAEKDNQIAQLTAMLQTAQAQQAALVQTLAAEQALHAGSIQKRLSETATTTENVVEKKDEEKSTQNFFSRLFKKNK